MGLDRRIKKNHAFVFITKNIAALLVLTSCSLSKKSPDAQVAKVFSEALNFRPLGEPLTSIGENENPSWSPDGKRIIYTSKGRLQHENAQIYEKNLDTSEEKRITYSDGDAVFPIYIYSGNKIIYSSTTDELKEHPHILKKPDSKEFYPSSDLYISDLSGANIVRLTERPGFDGMPIPSQINTDDVYFVSFVTNTRQIYKINLTSKKSTPLFQDNLDRRSFVSYKNKFAWVTTKAESNPVQQIFFAENNLKKPIALELGDAVIQDLEWANENILLMSAAFKERPYLQIYAYDLKSKCISPLFQLEGSEIQQPKVSPDRSKIIFVSNQIKNKKQIMVKSVDWTQISCAQSPKTN